MLGNIPLIEEGDKDKATQGDNMKASNKLIIRDIMGKVVDALKQAQQARGSRGWQ